jgi:hypothetical protein
MLIITMLNKEKKGGTLNKKVNITVNYPTCANEYQLKFYK